MSLSGTVDGEAGVQRRVARPVGIDAVIAVEIIVGGYKSGDAGVGIEASAEFVVVQVDRIRTGGENPGTVGTDRTWCCWLNIRDQLLRDGIDGAGRELGIGQNALRIGGATGEVVRLAGEIGRAHV